ncbi:hypothetical protein NQU39_25555, partial [Escherichia coli]|uniref:hypothetical protein n=1 Tax=Escherichia coli TaxID=562 RepID=UPI0021197D8D
MNKVICFALLGSLAFVLMADARTIKIPVDQGVVTMTVSDNMPESMIQDLIEKTKKKYATTTPPPPKAE